MPTVANNLYLYNYVRASGASELWKFTNLLYISLCTMIVKMYNQNLWGPLFVGAPGQLPTLPSPKSGPDFKYARASAQRHVFSFLRNVWLSQVIYNLSTNKHNYWSYQLHVAFSTKISLYWPVSIDFYYLLNILMCSTRHSSHCHNRFKGP